MPRVKHSPKVPRRLWVVMEPRLGKLVPTATYLNAEDIGDIIGDEVIYRYDLHE